MPDITAAHIVYLVGVIAILATMLFRKNIIVPAVFFTFLTALVFSGNLADALGAIFNASLVSAKELFNIFLIIALVTGLLGALQALGSDKRMIAPFRKIMRNGHSSFWVLVGVTYFISLFFWPTPAVPLIGAVLVPVAIRAGLRPLAVGFCIAVGGQGMALSSDFVIRVAPGLSAVSGGADPDSVANRAMVLSLVVGAVALAMGYLMEFRKIQKPSPALLRAWEEGDLESQLDKNTEVKKAPTIGHGVALRDHEYAKGAVRHHEERDGEIVDVDETVVESDVDEFAVETPAHVSTAVSKAFAIGVPLAYAALIGYLIYGMTQDDSTVGGDAAALVGGIAAMGIFLASFAESRNTFLERSAEHVVDGLVFAFKAMGVVLPIAGFFFIGNSDFSGTILGVAPNEDGSPAAPGFLFDLVTVMQDNIPQNAFITALGLMVVGVVAGLDGSGFSGLPLTGSLAGSLGEGAGISAETLAAVGQMGNIWSGGGTLVAWSSLIAVAGFARVNVIELARMLFIPVVTGLFVATIVAVVFMP